MALAGHEDDDSVRISTFANLFNVLRTDQVTVRSEGRHAGGGFQLGRLFGGQTVEQIHLVFRCLKPHLVVHTLRVNFVAPGNVDDPIDFTFSELPGGEFMVAQITQKGRTIASAKYRFGLSNDLLDQSPFFMPPVGSPLSYSPFNESLRTLRNENVASAFEHIMKRALFEMRPVDFEHVTLQKPSWEPVRFWCTLNTPYKNSVAERDDISVVLLLSDYMVIHPVRIHYKQLGRGRNSAAPLR